MSRSSYMWFYEQKVSVISILECVWCWGNRDTQTAPVMSEDYNFTHRAPHHTLSRPTIHYTRDRAQYPKCTYTYGLPVHLPPSIARKTWEAIGLFAKVYVLNFLLFFMCLCHRLYITYNGALSTSLSQLN